MKPGPDVPCLDQISAGLSAVTRRTGCRQSGGRTENREQSESALVHKRANINLCPNDRNLGQFLAHSSICERHAL